MSTADISPNPHPVMGLISMGISATFLVFGSFGAWLTSLPWPSLIMGGCGVLSAFIGYKASVDRTELADLRRINADLVARLKRSDKEGRS